MSTMKAAGGGASGERRFVIAEHQRGSLVWWAVGVALAFFAVLGFLAALFGSANQLQRQLMTTVPLIMAIGAFVKAWTARKIPSAVRMNPRGLVVERGDATQAIDWDAISLAAMDTTPMSQQKQLTLYDMQGRKIVAIADSFPEFKEFAKIAQAEVEARASDASDAVRMTKSRRNALILAGISPLLLAAAIGGAYLARERQRELALLPTVVPVEATIVRRFVAPNGVTKRLEYEVRDANGATATRNAEVTDDYWVVLENATTVPVVAVPGQPGISRLVMGEITSDDDPSESPLVMYGLSLVMALFCLFCMAMAVVAWKGWDLRFDSETKKLSFKRYGSGM
jgi:hypothetical protein